MTLPGDDVMEDVVKHFLQVQVLHVSALLLLGLEFAADERQGIFQERVVVRVRGGKEAPGPLIPTYVASTITGAGE